MKKVLLIALTLFFAIPNLQAKGDDEDVKIVLVKEENSDNYYYEGVVPVEGVSKEEMFKRAKAWVLANFKTGDNNSQFDESNWQIYNTPTILVKAGPKIDADYVNFKLVLLFKEGKYKFRFDNLIIKQHVATIASQPMPYNDKKIFDNFGNKYNKWLIESINRSFENMAVDLENVIKGAGAKKDDW